MLRRMVGAVIPARSRESVTRNSAAVRQLHTRCARPKIQHFPPNRLMGRRLLRTPRRHFPIMRENPCATAILLDRGLLTSSRLLKVRFRGSAGNELHLLLR